MRPRLTLGLINRKISSCSYAVIHKQKAETKFFIIKLIKFLKGCNLFFKFNIN